MVNLLRSKARKHNVIEQQGDTIIMFDEKGNFTLIDAEDYIKVKDIYWYQEINGYWRGYNGTRAKLLLHRCILEAPKGLVVDHINHKRFDNRKTNIRLCSQSQNLMNRKHNCIYYEKERNKWRARLEHLGKRYDLGRYSTKEEALAVIKDFKEKHFKEFYYREERGAAEN